MSRRYKIVLDYDGTGYHGWQKQQGRDVRTIQGELEGILEKVTGKVIPVTGCGRTDAGVHARGYVAHFDLDRAADILELTYKLNRMSSPQIAVNVLQESSPDFHARFSAISRSYQYNIHFHKQPFKRHYSLGYPYRCETLDLDLLMRSTNYLLGDHDFTTFCKLGGDQTHNRCMVDQAYWHKTNDGLRFEIKANRYLRGMIRLIVGMSLNVARGTLTISQVEKAFVNQENLRIDWSVPAEGLMLYNIIYPD